MLIYASYCNSHERRIGIWLHIEYIKYRHHNPSLNISLLISIICPLSEGQDSMPVLYPGCDYINKAFARSSEFEHPLVIRLGDSLGEGVQVVDIHARVFNHLDILHFHPLFDGPGSQVL